MPRKKLNIAVAGATGAVGNQMITCLEEADFPVKSITFLASARSVGRTLRFKGDPVPVKELAEGCFKGIDIALFSAGGSTSERFAPDAARDGCVVVDNSSAWRMDPQVPLVVPEVNPHAVAGYTRKGIIANPNCSTIQMVVALNPIHKAFGIKRVVVSTYQSVSGTGKKAIDELFNQTRSMINFLDVQRSVYPHRIAFNCLPHIDKFLDNGYTKEEMKMVNETRKIMEDPAIAVTATTVPGARLLRALRIRQRRDPASLSARRGPQAPGVGPRRQGGGRPSPEPLSARDRSGGTGSHPGRRHPPRRVGGARGEPSDRGRQHPQGGGHQRRADCADPCG